MTKSEKPNTEMVELKTAETLEALTKAVIELKTEVALAREESNQLSASRPEDEECGQPEGLKGQPVEVDTGDDWRASDEASENLTELPP